VKDFIQSREVFHSDGTPRPMDDAPALRALRGETIKNEIELMHGPQGTIIYREVSSSPVRDASNKIVGSISVVRDVTERKSIEEALRSAHEELEIRVRERTGQLQNAYQSLIAEIEERKMLEERLRQSQKMEAIGTLAGGIAHDFNNILAGIIGFSEMVEEDLPEGSVLRGYMTNVLKASFRGRDLVKQILAFSRKTEHSRDIISVGPVVKETVKLLRSSLPSSLELVLEPSARNDHVHASAVELQQILMNLVTNAARAIGDNGGRVRISLSDEDIKPNSALIDSDLKPGDYLKLSIADTGTGMSADVMLRIFEPFYTTRRLGEGTGMGLAVVYGIVKSLNGTVTVESEEGSGSTFHVYIPQVKRAVELTPEMPLKIARGKERILCVDDEELLVRLNTDILEKLGYTVTALNDSTEALNVFLSDPFAFDLVITDQTMPKLSGLRLAREILRIRRDIPIILCTGHSDAVSPEIVRDAGIKMFIMKPLARKELADAIRSVLENRTSPFTQVSTGAAGTDSTLIQ
jgi:signal transduction histidine kinase/ActR/RegA family two-component response regulator